MFVHDTFYLLLNPGINSQNQVRRSLFSFAPTEAKTQSINKSLPPVYHSCQDSGRTAELIVKVFFQPSLSFSIFRPDMTDQMSGQRPLAIAMFDCCNK